VADLDEAFGQNVLEEAAYKFCWWQRCGLVAACAKDDCVIIRGDQPAVADSDAMGVAAQILIHLLGPAKGPFGVHDPACLI